MLPLKLSVSAPSLPLRVPYLSPARGLDSFLGLTIAYPLSRTFMWTFWMGVGLSPSLRYPFPMIDESLLAKVAGLTPADRLEPICVVWDMLSLDDLPMTDAERALLDARLADMERNTDDQSPWPEVKARLERLTR